MRLHVVLAVDQPRAPPPARSVLSAGASAPQERKGATGSRAGNMQARCLHCGCGGLYPSLKCFIIMNECGETSHTDIALTTIHQMFNSTDPCQHKQPACICPLRLFLLLPGILHPVTEANNTILTIFSRNNTVLAGNRTLIKHARQSACFSFSFISARMT